MIFQETFFLQQEANNWFQRNQAVLETFDRDDKFDWVCYLLKLLNEKDKLNNIVDIGCSNGWRLNKLSQQGFGKYFFGVDASLEAIQSGKVHYPHLNLYQGMLSQLPLKTEFDLVIVAGVLHCVDRHTLVRSIAEIDRVTKDEGVLIIGDFLPDFQQRRHNHHYPEEPIYTYKQDYAKIFESFGMYRELIKVTSHYDEPGVPTNSGENSSRFGWTCLQKSLHSFYPEIS
ncbi:class I SAM-dependent methyltransferase [Scytonema sp. UIC 10036]|uniref:methyltransferase domain-containing protein n=1 Tax=Scytonema sp. UIC 10036 TaxID=2304196 RepID=UPI00140F73E0